MVIHFHNGDSDREIKIILPTDLILNPLAAAIAAKALNKKSNGKAKNRIDETATNLAKRLENGDEEEITAAAKDVVIESLAETAVAMNLDAATLNEAFRTLKQFKKKHPHLPLVDVISSDGDKILIQL